MKSKTLRLVTGFIAASSLWISSLPVLGVDVYRNTQQRTDRYYAPGSIEFGDEIFLTQFGPSAALTNFSFEYFGAGLNGNETVTLRFYRNNGGPVTGVPGAAKPGTQLYDSGAIALNQYPNNGNTTVDGNTLVFAVLNQGTWFNNPPGVIPNANFTWTVQFTGLGLGETAGLDVYNLSAAGNLGSSANDFWELNPGTQDWELKLDGSGTPIPMNFAALAEAVPEASPLQIGLLAVAIWVGRSIYRRKTATA
jgi:hypothetical protein